MNDGPHLLLDHMLNLLLEDIVEIFHQGIEVDDDNNPALENLPEVRFTTAANITELNWKGGGNICTRKAANMHNSPAVFTNYAWEGILCMSKLDLFLILFPVNYLKIILIPETKTICRV